MAKKSPVSCQHTLKVAEEFAVEYNALLKKSGKEIDLSDIPELDFNEMGKPVVVKFYHPKE